MNNQTTPTNSTEYQILVTALHLFLTQGIKKVTMDDVAHAAGMTRVTVYRYFSNKKDLVTAAFMHIIADFEQARQYVEAQPDSDIETVIDMIGRSLASLPPCDFPARLNELNRVYPQVYQQFQNTRLAALDAIFQHIFTLAESQNKLQPGIRREVVQVYFMETVVNVVDNPRLIALNLSPDEIFQTVKSIFLYGILKGNET